MEVTKQWFTTEGYFTSCFDLIGDDTAHEVGIGHLKGMDESLQRFLVEINAYWSISKWYIRI